MDVIVTADGSRTLTSSEFGETYGSRHGALTEARHVFLAGSGVQGRLAAGLQTAVLEVGFGTGLNFLVTAAAALEHEGSLRYTAVERAPVDARTLRALYQGSELEGPLATSFVDWVDGLGTPVAPGRYSLTLGTQQAVVLELLIGEARQLLAGGSGATGAQLPGYDAIYLDAFSPKANQELWTHAFLAVVAAYLAPGGTLVTFSVSGAVRRALTAAGLRVSKLPGPPGGKPQMLAASRPPVAP